MLDVQKLTSYTIYTFKSCECYDASALSGGDIMDPFGNNLFS